MGYAPISRITVAPSPAISGVSLTVAEDSGAIFPNARSWVALCWPEGQIPAVGSNAEYVQVIAQVGDTMVIVRSASPVAIEEGWLFAVVEKIPNYERGDTVTIRGHFEEDDQPYAVHVRDPQGGSAVYRESEGVSDDTAGVAAYQFLPEMSGLWGYRWEGASGQLEDTHFFVNHSDVL